MIPGLANPDPSSPRCPCGQMQTGAARPERVVARGLVGFAVGVLLQCALTAGLQPSVGWRLTLALLPLHVLALGASLTRLLCGVPRPQWPARCGFGALSPTVFRQVFGCMLCGLPLVYLLHAGSAGLCRLLGLGPALPGAFGMLAEMTSAGARTAAVLVLVLWVPLAEELLFRYLLTDALDGVGVRGAGLWSAAAFAAAHGSVAQLPPLLVLGLLLQRLRREPGGLWGPLIAHSAFNGLSLLGWALLG